MKLLYKRENLEWKVIEGTDNRYEVSNYGDIHRKEYSFVDKANRYLHYEEKYIWSEEQFEYGGSNLDSRYLGVHCGLGTKKYAHIIAATAFIPNPNNKPEVNHKDGNHKNNYCGCKKNNYEDSNLEWVTHEENIIHAVENGLINHESILRKYALKKNREKIDYEKMKKPVISCNSITGEFVSEFSSIKEAAESLNIYSSTIRSVLSHDGYHKTAGGYTWVYKHEYCKDKLYKAEVDQCSGTRKPIIQKNLEGDFIAEYSSIQEACRINGFNGNGYISECCKKKRKHYKNFLWEYKNE